MSITSAALVSTVGNSNTNSIKNMNNEYTLKNLSTADIVSHLKHKIAIPVGGGLQLFWGKDVKPFLTPPAKPLPVIPTLATQLFDFIRGIRFIGTPTEPKWDGVNKSA